MAELGIRVYFLASFMVWLSKCDTVMAKAEIKCYCTTPECELNSNNFCKSTLGKCFSQIALSSDVKDIHGCTEQLDSDMRNSCLQNGDGDIISTKKDSAYALMCCKGDMCNFFESSKDRPMSLDIINGNADNNVNATTQNGHNQRGSSRRRHPSNQSEDVYYSSKELWFKAAVIAVPIAGGFILIMLVVLAIRMLRHDNRRHREYKHNQSLAKAQLYVADHFYNPNNKLLCTEDEYKTVVQPQECVFISEHHMPKQGVVRNCSGGKTINSKKVTSTTISSPTNSIVSNNSNNSSNNNNKDVNIVIQNDSGSNTHKYEKLRESTGFENACDSVIVWNDNDVKQSTGVPKDTV